MFPDKEQVSLTVIGNHSHVRADLVLPSNDSGYQYQYMDDENWEYTESTLNYRDGEWYLHLGYRKEKPDDPIGSTTQNGAVLGVDLGVNQIAVTSTERFFDGDKLAHNRREFERIRGNLQETGTQSTHRTIDELSGREDEYIKHVMHFVVNGIMEEALTHDCDVIVFEELDGIREDLQQANWHAGWAFRKLREFVAYKAEAEGLYVDTVNLENTSKQCNECGHVSNSNRSHGEFGCESCGKHNHVDYNVARILRNCISCEAISRRVGGASVNTL